MIWRSLQQTVAPTQEPLDLPEVKEHLRITSDDENASIRRLIQVARQVAERKTRRQLCTATWVMKLDKFPNGNGSLLLPPAPLQSVSSVAYVDANGASQTVSGTTIYTSDTADEPGQLLLRYGQAWPTDQRSVENAVTVTYLSGWAARTSVPVTIKQAMLLLIAHFYENREPLIIGQGFAALKIPMTVDMLLASEAVPEFA